MKRIFFLLILCASSVIAMAQIKITGVVKDSKSSETIVGVTVVEHGTNNVTMTDLDGTYTILVNNEKATLDFSTMGYKNQQIVIGQAKVIDILLVEDALNIDEVVVTALNLPKQKKVLGYAVQEVKGSELSTSREANPMSSLVGKVAGMRIAIPSDLMKSPEITLRGVSPMIVVDGVPIASDTWNISPDDIESMNVLKGPTAAALYGSQGKNGAIQITTKRGTGSSRNFSVEINSTTQFQTGFTAIPKVQNMYGPGYDYQYDFGDGLKGNINGVNNSDSDVWGPRFEGQLIKQWNSPMDANGVRTPTPWLSIGKDNLKNYMQTGLVSTNNIAISQRTDAGDFRLSVSNMYQKGLFPNTKLNSANINMTGSSKLGKKVTLQGALNYNNTSSPNYPDVVYNPRSPLYLLTVWTGAQIDVNQMKDYWVPGMEGVQQYNYDYAQYNNPWFLAYENTRGHYKDDVHGQANLTWRITPNLDFRFRSNISTYNLNKNEKYPVSGSVYDSAYKWVGGYEESNERYMEYSNDVLLNYAKQISRNIGIKASLGASYRTQRYNYSWESTYGGLIVPGIYTLQNSIGSRPGSSNRWTKDVGSIYGFVDLDYKNYLFLSVTGRMDKSSTLPMNNNTYFYPSVSLSAVISDMVDLSSVFSFLRVRGSYANVGGDLGVYELNNFYTYGSMWNKETPMYMGSQLYDPNIKPEFSSSYEFGLDMRFFQNRLGFDIAYFYAEDGPQIFSLDTPTSSGFDKRKVNGLTYERKGFEGSFTALPIKNKAFSWEISGNVSSVRRFLKKVYGDIENLGQVKIGERADQMWVTDFMRSADGQVIYKDGMPQKDPIKKLWGYYEPDFIYGISNRFNYKNFSLFIGIDGSVGGKIQNDTWENLWRSGRHELSDNEWRLADWDAYKQDPAGFGKTYKGVFVGDGVVQTGGELKRDPSGNIISDTRTYEKNSTPVIYQNWAGSSRGYYRTQSVYIQDRTFAKLREVTLTYNFPKEILKKTKFITAASASFVGRNLLYWAKADYIDLDQFTGSGTVLQTPSTRNFGFNINITF